MFTRLLFAGVAIATLATAMPAAAQSAADDARFAQAQARFDRELQVYRTEFNRYRAARDHDGGFDSRYDNQGYDDRAAPQVPYPQQYDDNDGYDDERDEGSYDPSRYYRSGPSYQERVLSSDDRVYAGNDGRYYCKRNDGTTGLIVGGVAGGVLGNVIDGGHSRIVGTLLGGAAGALAGKAIDQDSNRQIRCR